MRNKKVAPAGPLTCWILALFSIIIHCFALLLVVKPFRKLKRARVVNNSALRISEVALWLALVTDVVTLIRSFILMKPKRPSEFSKFPDRYFLSLASMSVVLDVVSYAYIWAKYTITRDGSTWTEQSSYRGFVVLSLALCLDASYFAAFHHFRSK